MKSADRRDLLIVAIVTVLILAIPLTLVLIGDWLWDQFSLIKR